MAVSAYHIPVGLEESSILCESLLHGISRLDTVVITEVSVEISNCAGSWSVCICASHVSCALPMDSGCGSLDQTVSEPFDPEGVKKTRFREPYLVAGTA